MAFQKRHYEEVARTIKTYGESDPTHYLPACKMMEAMADMFQRDNSRFDRKRFYDACTPNKPESN